MSRLDAKKEREIEIFTEREGITVKQTSARIGPERLEEINKRLDDLKKRGLDGFEARARFHENAESDIEYLVEENERLRGDIAMVMLENKELKELE